jgi:hypothetical protein
MWLPVRVIATVFAVTTVLGAPSSWATPFTGPTSRYYIDNFDDQTIYVVQGTSVINSFPWAYGSGCSSYCEGNLAVTNKVSTDSFSGSGTAGQYTLGGKPTGKSWPATVFGASYHYDGTSDGKHNYTVDLGNNNVIVTDLNWQHPAALFSLPGTGRDWIGAAYDPQNNSLWISGYATDVIADFSLNGTLLSSFHTGLPMSGSIFGVLALGFDPADATLWFAYSGFNTLYQYSTSGAFLQSGIPSGLPTYGVTGGNDAGDFAEPKRHVSELEALPTPPTLPLLAPGLGLIALLVRRRRTNVGEQG